MYSTKDNVELNRIDIYKYADKIGDIEYEYRKDNTELFIGIPKFIDDFEIITVELQKVWTTAIKNKQDEFIKNTMKTNGSVDIGFEIVADLGDGTEPIKMKL